LIYVEKLNIADTDVYFSRTTTVDDKDIESLFAQVSKARAAKARRYKKRDRMIQALLAEYLLLYALKELGYTETPEISYEDRMKPFLISPKNVSFNFSHTTGAAVCAVSQSYAVGADIETLRKCRPSVAKKFLPSTNFAALWNAHKDDRDRLFTQFWTRYEAELKLEKDAERCETFTHGEFFITCARSR